MNWPSSTLTCMELVHLTKKGMLVLEIEDRVATTNNHHLQVVEQ